MKLLENISDFNKVADYLPIVNGAINADIINDVLDISRCLQIFIH